MRKYLPGILILSILLTLSQTAQARDYEIEVIVFEQAGSRTEAEADSAEAEKWDFSDRKIANALQHIAALESGSDDFLIETALDRLDQARQQLSQAGHRIIRTASWIQPSAVYQYAPLISLGLADSSLTGFIRVYKTSLIYADIDLQFSPESASSTTLPDWSSALSPSPDNLPEHYFLSEKRRLKFKEVHYFDHPKFGAIVGIWPSAN